MFSLELVVLGECLLRVRGSHARILSDSFAKNEETRSANRGSKGLVTGRMLCMLFVYQRYSWFY